MGLMTDGLHETIEEMAMIMAGVARGVINPDTLGRWVFNHFPEHATKLPAHMREKLCLTDRSLIHSLRESESKERNSIGPGFRDPTTGVTF